MMHPYLQEHIRLSAAWQQPKPVKEPFTVLMFDALCLRLESASSTRLGFLSKEAAVYDWMRLGVFTGSRVSEYAQTKLKAGQQFQVLTPDISKAGIWAGARLAFIIVDFTLLDANLHFIPCTRPFMPLCALAGSLTCTSPFVMTKVLGILSLKSTPLRITLFSTLLRLPPPFFIELSCWGFLLTTLSACSPPHQVAKPSFVTTILRLLCVKPAATHIPAPPITCGFTLHPSCPTRTTFLPRSV
jgi:hypothetical protein